ncbi:GTPase [Calycomorphotria hydatis]|uniref:tRNA modification GTPase MnmE n=1 Tax=Calycomorphotria hydatis TaxID=2528027 RepID=A0A517TBH4_9PLAN|nr:GTPase [Calycomorphotria hydatis]QDT65717.1 tRNA modification GTPase MnmE [Calycomorphotria hydatis]
MSESTATGTTPSITRLTPSGRGAVATLLFRGDALLIDEAGLFQAANGKKIGEQAIGNVVFGHWGEADDAGTEEVVLCRTSSQECEIHCHGGMAAVRRIVGQLTTLGIQELGGWEPIGETSRLELELREAVTRAATERTAKYLWAQASGVFRTAIETIRDAEDHAQKLAAINQLLHWAKFGRHLIEPWRVVLYGRPNVGKSSLINALVGYGRAIVSSTAGTTRDVVTALTALDGWPIQLSDTAGLRTTADELEAAGIEKSDAQIAAADLKVLVLDASESLTDDDQLLLERTEPHLIVLNKIDLSAENAESHRKGAIAVSAITGEGLSELTAEIVSQLVPEVPDWNTPIPVLEHHAHLLSEIYADFEAGDTSAAEHRIAELLG